MVTHTEPLDSLTGRVATGIHQVATFVIVASTSTREELDLAALILRRDPNRSAPRESASAVETFNRLLDVAIDSANETAGCGTRAERRARLCAALERERVVIIDSDTLANLIDAKLELDAQIGYVLEAPVLEAAEDEPCSNPHCDDLESCIACGKGSGGAFGRDLMLHGSAVARVHGAGSVEHVPLADFYERAESSAEQDGNGGSYNGLEFMGGDRHADFNPSVND